MALLLLLQAFLILHAPAPPAPVRTPLPRQAPTDRQQADFRRLTREAERVRHLRFTRPVPSFVQSREATRRYLEKTLDEENDWTRDSATLKAFGFVDEPFDLRAFSVDFYTEQVAGYYDYRSRSFYMVRPDDTGGPLSGLHRLLGARSEALDDSMVIHEMDHALQDQHFDLARLDRLTRGSDQDDFGLAVNSLIEGDATVVMLVSMLKGSTVPLDAVIKAGSNGMSSMPGAPQFDRAPLYFQKIALFPYTAGARFVSYLRRSEGWRGVDARYATARLPRSTAEILHPERHPNGMDPPTRIALGADPPLASPGWRRVAENTLGEERMRVLWEQYAADAPDRLRWSDGWHGDLFRIYAARSLPAHRFVVWRSAWDSETTADAFVEGIRVVLERRRRLPAAPGCVTRVERRGREVVVLEGVPRILYDGMRATAWGLQNDTKGRFPRAAR